MRVINIVFTDEEFEKLRKQKIIEQERGKNLISWHAFIIKKVLGKN